MKILDRYIFSELVPPFFLGVFLFTFVMLTNLLIKLTDLFITKGVDFLTVLSLLGLSIPYLLVMTIPMSVLLAVLAAFGRFSSDSEIAAMKSSGISLHRMMPPVILFALCVYIITSFIYIGLLPETNLQLKQLRYDILRRQASIGIKPHVFNTDFIHLVIYVNDVDHGTGVMKGVFIADNRNSDQPLVIVARKGFEVADPKQNTVTLRLTDGCTHEILKGKRQRYSTTPFTHMDLNLDMTIFQQAAVTKSDREMTISELLEKARTNDQKGRNSNRQWLEIWKKTSFPFACFVFAFLGVPLGISTRKGGKSACFATSLGLILIYYILLTGGTGLSEEGKLSPFIATWAPNILLTVLAVYLYIKQALEMPASTLRKRLDEFVFSLERKIKLRRPVKSHPLAVRTMADINLKGIRILDRYVMSQFLILFVYIQVALMSISLIVHAFEKIDNLLENQASLVDALIAIGFNLPYFGFLAIHFSTLVATILTIGTLNRTSELIAMKASGISYLRITASMIVLGLVLSGFAFLLNESIIPYSNRQVEQAWDRIKSRERTKFVRYHRWYRGKSGDIYFFQHYDPREEKIAGFSLFNIDQSMNILSRLEASRVEWVDRRWVTDDARNIVMSSGCRLLRDESTSRMVIDIPEKPADFSKEYKESEEMNLRELKEYIRILRSIGFDTTEYEVDWHSKLSIPFLSVIMVLIGIAFSSQNPRSAGGMRGLGMAILIGAVYFLLFRIGLEFGQAGQYPPIIAAWICNGIFLVLACWLLFRANRYS
ncbi:LPS export ABC transporter permease LptG [bacterium]|nr:LPS export ABC transporter permease LptG [candidate division CSSED10-310 bacterium]